MTGPKVSVVMGVYNGENTLHETIVSVLDQEGVELEFIIVNDGSTDNTGNILHEYARRDARIRLIESCNQGLTLALIRGCVEAKGDYVARQDAGDASLPSRLAKQAALLELHSDTVMVSCGTRFLGPAGELVREVKQSSWDAEKGLRNLSLSGVRGPSHHGSVMFRRDVYEQVGGYRWQFYVAQDLDLWLRLAEKGEHRVIDSINYQASMIPGAISIRQRDLQLQTAKLILKAARLRRGGGDETSILENASRLTANLKKENKPEDTAAYYYFLGCNLATSDRALARQYFLKAIKKDALFARAVFRWIQSRSGF